MTQFVQMCLEPLMGGCASCHQPITNVLFAQYLRDLKVGRVKKDGDT